MANNAFSFFFMIMARYPDNIYLTAIAFIIIVLIAVGGVIGVITFFIDKKRQKRHFTCGKEVTTVSDEGQNQREELPFFKAAVGFACSPLVVLCVVWLIILSQATFV